MLNLFRKHGRSVTYLLLTDYLGMVGTFGLALRLRHYNPAMNIIDVSELQIIPEVSFSFVYAFLVIGLFGTCGLYKRKIWLTRAWHSSRILLGCLLSIGFYLLLKSLFKGASFLESRMVTMNWGLMMLFCIAANRLLVFPSLLRMGSQANLKRRVVIIGAMEDGIAFARQCMREDSYSMLKPIGFLSDARNRGEVIEGWLTCLGGIDDLPDIVDLYKIEGAVITTSEMTHARLLSTIEQCIRYFGWVDVHTDHSAVLHTTLDADTYFDIPFVRMREVQNGPLFRMYKRTVDIVLSMLALIVLSPLLLLVAAAIKLTSPGPVLYVHERVGLKGRTFPFYKFRSMVVGADQDRTRSAAIREYIQSENSGHQSKIVNTAHVTPVGRFIRKWAIDELPQLFNVLKGDMSLVGPRPVPQGEFELNDDWHKKRFEIKPGCTGLWKVYAVRYANMNFNNTVLYDIYYARNMTPFLDLYIIASTIKIILSGKADGMPLGKKLEQSTSANA